MTTYQTGSVFSAHLCVNHALPEANWHPHISLRSRFRGALMGLAIVPVALQLELKSYHQTHWEGLMQTIAPGLLRHHNHRQRRNQWLSQTTLNQAIFGETTIQQFFMAGDWLEAVMTSQGAPLGVEPLTPSYIQALMAQHERREAGALYSQIFHAVAQQAATLTESYTLSVKMSGQMVKQKGQPINAFDDNEPLILTPALMGFLAGATVGIASLPVLWQMRLTQTGMQGISSSGRQTILTLADQLYEQWAGVLS
ncbi:MAG: hypothetical protein AAF703_11220 [Cyanobacteria bacterium P01_D01_bin.105]